MPVRRILLIGAGHGHLEVLRRFALKPDRRHRAHAGRARLRLPVCGDAPGLDRRPLRRRRVAGRRCRRSPAGRGARFVCDRAVELDLYTRIVRLAEGGVEPFDLRIARHRVVAGPVGARRARARVAAPPHRPLPCRLAHARSRHRRRPHRARSPSWAAAPTAVEMLLAMQYPTCAHARRRRAALRARHRGPAGAATTTSRACASTSAGSWSRATSCCTRAARSPLSKPAPSSLPAAGASRPTASSGPRHLGRAMACRLESRVRRARLSSASTHRCSRCPIRSCLPSATARPRRSWHRAACARRPRGRASGGEPAPRRAPRAARGRSAARAPAVRHHHRAAARDRVAGARPGRRRARLAMEGPIDRAATSPASSPPAGGSASRRSRMRHASRVAHPSPRSS